MEKTVMLKTAALMGAEKRVDGPDTLSVTIPLLLNPH